MTTKKKKIHQLDLNLKCCGCTGRAQEYPHQLDILVHFHHEETTTTQEVLLVLYLNTDSYSKTGIRTTNQCISTFST